MAKPSALRVATLSWRALAAVGRTMGGDPRYYKKKKIKPGPAPLTVAGAVRLIIWAAFPIERSSVT